MLQYLRCLGYPRDQIIIQTQCREDYISYSELYYQDAIITYKRGTNISENKNNLLDYICEKYPRKKVVVLSDKVRSIQYLNVRSQKCEDIKSKKILDKLINRCFELSDFYNAELFGCYHCGNAFFMKPTITLNAQILGCFMGITNPQKWRFDKRLPLKEDFELVMRVIRDGGCVLRLNDVAIKATFHTNGGCHAWWNAKNDGANEFCNKYILSKYIGLVKKHATRKNEQTYIGKTQTIKRSVINDILRFATMDG